MGRRREAGTGTGESGHGRPPECFPCLQRAVCPRPLNAEPAGDLSPASPAPPDAGLLPPQQPTARLAWVLLSPGASPLWGPRETPSPRTEAARGPWRCPSPRDPSPRRPPRDPPGSRPLGPWEKRPPRPRGQETAGQPCLPRRPRPGTGLRRSGTCQAPRKAPLLSPTPLPALRHGPGVAPNSHGREGPQRPAGPLPRRAGSWPLRILVSSLSRALIIHSNPGGSRLGGEPP